MKNPYKALALVIGIHFLIMYALTFSAVNNFSNVSPFNTRSLYMAVVMVTPMAILMMFFMRHMYENKRANIFLYSASFVTFLLAFLFIRGQVFVNNERFLQSMIPHHAGAITMCERASIDDPEILKLCDQIIKAQQEEIDEMKRIQKRLNR